MKHIPRKRFGQNFLVDVSIVNAIVSAVAPQVGETVVEIGPGLGALTEPLLKHLPCLHVVEIDRDLIARLKRLHAPERLVVHEGDALAFDFGTLGAGLRIVGNLPYNISSPLLFHLAIYATQVKDMHFMLQKEVVDRMVATAGDSEFGRLSVMLQYRFDIQALFDVPPESFDPPPKVQSAVVRLIPRPPAELTARDETLFARLVTMAFSQRRKMLRNTLKGEVSEEEFAAAGITPSWRAEDVPVAAYVALANLKAK